MKRLKLFIASNQTLYFFLGLFWYPVKKIKQLIRLIKLRGFNKPEIIELDEHLKLFVDPRNGFVDESIFIYKSWSPEFTDVISKSKMRGGTFIDVGANIGYFTILCITSGYFDNALAFEPIRNIQKSLKKNIEINKIAENVHVFPFALSNKNASVNIKTNSKNMGSSKIVFNEKDGGGYEKIETRTFDSLEIKINERCLIKIDAEGHEPQVLEGMRVFIEKNKPEIILEYSPSLMSKDLSRKLIEDLFLLGYQMEDIYSKDVFSNMSQFPFKKYRVVGQTDLFCAPA